MQRSQYLVEALQSMSQAPDRASVQSPALQAPDKAARDQWKANNPGKSYMAHGLGQAAKGLINAPQTMAKGVMGQPGGGGLRGLLSLGQQR